ncbi:MAG: haloacid dehalogenase [Acidimicrobiales bacterium]
MVESLVATCREELDQAHRAREAGLLSCRKVVQLSGRAIRAVHRLQPEQARRLVEEAALLLSEAQRGLTPFPAVKWSGFVQDAEKEYAEAVLTAHLVANSALPSHSELGVTVGSWLGGLAEAASELRRHLLDRLRSGELRKAERLLAAMEEVYDNLFLVEHPDALTPGLRRSTDALRAVLERSRADVTTTACQARLERAMEALAAATQG